MTAAEPAQSPDPRQTQSYIRNLLSARGIAPRRKMGQNFLVDLNLLDLIVRTAELDKRDSILEIGSGTGGLTAKLAEHAGAVVSVELDPEFHDMVKDVLRGRANVKLLYADALARKNELNPGVLEAWEQSTAEFGCDRRKLVANLPYAIATPVIANLLISGVAVERMVVMVQWELAERMVAVPGTKDYGALAVLAQSLADTTVVRRLAPSAFWPKPKVDSAIVLIQPNESKRQRVGDVASFRAFLRDLYTHRRKNLRQAITAWPSGRRDKAEVDAALAELGVDGTVRAESLDVEQHLRLCAKFASEAAIRE